VLASLSAAIRPGQSNLSARMRPVCTIVVTEDQDLVAEATDRAGGALIMMSAPVTATPFVLP
jgi:hypothetical protein